MQNRAQTGKSFRKRAGQTSRTLEPDARAGHTSLCDPTDNYARAVAAEGGGAFNVRGFSTKFFYLRLFYMPTIFNKKGAKIL